ncbi:replicative DNA helicase [Merismopedia glauca]|uniref:Replicative DNA helicase n=1 Tax=Merismopedia glauca CCAP 1448/3 TaxID=1296344 RepID=A0A2T1BXV9_9CYAN|nr:replicative DNA helicase [Merismopedia glauca]PSB00849.1 replicative DNA helicase [Merismopedia glauca CCAP 1448/3]
MNDTTLQNIAAEESILGGILLDPSAISRVIDVLIPEAFYIEAHAIIYRTATELYRQDKPTDLMSLESRLSDRKLLKKVGGKAKLAGLLERTVSAVNIDHLASLVVEKYQRRQLIAAGGDLVELGQDTATDIASIFDQAQAKIFNLTVSQQSQFQPTSIGDCLIEVFDKISEGSSPAYPTGLADLDALIGGLVKQDLIVIAARASMGKTWLACYLANYIATTQNKPVVFFSAEMSKEQLTKRLLAMHSSIDSHRLIHNQVYNDEYEALVKALGVLTALPIIIDDTPASLLSPAKVRSVLRQVRHERGELGLVVLDYIQKLGDRAAGNRAQAVGKFSGAFKDIAKEFDIPFIALAQINRGVESQSNKRPGMADIKDSGDIEQDMDLGLLLYRDEYYNADSQDRGVMEVIVGKNRNGSVGTCKVSFDPRVGKFINL